MQIEERVVGEVTILDLKGKITLGEGDEALKDKINSLTLQKRKHILLNLEGVPYIDSAGLGEVVRTYTTVSRQGGQLKLVNLTKRITDLLSITKLLTVFETFDTEAGSAQELQVGMTGRGPHGLPSWFEVPCRPPPRRIRLAAAWTVLPVGRSSVVWSCRPAAAAVDEEPHRLRRAHLRRAPARSWPRSPPRSWRSRVFCVLSGVVYLVNDVRDREADRLHPVKSRRPIAAGDLSPAAALASRRCSSAVLAIATAFGLSRRVRRRGAHLPGPARRSTRSRSSTSSSSTS